MNSFTLSPSNMPSLDPREIVFTTLTGPPFVVIILNWGLFGVLSIQVYLYSQAFPKDRPALKALVYAVYLLETAQTMLLTGSIWDMLARGFGDLLGIDEIGTNWLSVCLIGGLVGLLVQWFYAYRISVISQSRTAPCLIILLSLVSFAGAIATTVFAIRAKRFTKLFTMSLGFNVQPLGFWSGTGSACDIVIAACMCYYLRRRNPYGSFSQTQALISRLVRMTVETGVLTASISLLTLALYYPPSTTPINYFVVPLSAQAKLYSTTMLAVLNSRMHVGIVSASEAAGGWRDYELSSVPVARSAGRHVEAGGMQFKVGSLSTAASQSESVFATKGEGVSGDQAKGNLRFGPGQP